MASAGCRSFAVEQGKPVEGADHGSQHACGDLGVERGRIELGVPQQNLDDADVDAVFQKVGGEGMA